MQQKLTRREGLTTLLATGVAMLTPGLDSYVSNTQSGAVYAQEQEKKETKRVYHPAIEDYERELHKTISPLIPTYDEFLIGPSVLRDSILKIRKDPKIVQGNKNYGEFEEHLKDHYKNSKKGGFLEQDNLSRSSLLKGREVTNPNLGKGRAVTFGDLSNGDLQAKYGFKINFKSPSEADKATMFLYQIWNQMESKIRGHNKGIMIKVLDEINKSDRIPILDYKNNRFIKEVRPDIFSRTTDYVADFTELIKFPNSEYGFEIDLNLTPRDISHLKTNFKGKDLFSNSREHGYLTKRSFFRDKKITLEISAPKFDIVRKGQVEIYNSNGEKIFGSKDSTFDIDARSNTGDIDFGRIIGNGPVDTHSVALFINNKCQKVIQIEVRP